MTTRTSIPLFPLSILPLPGELVPLHIYEPQYRELLLDAEKQDISFGIYCTDPLNHERIGSIMKLESVIKRYDTGEADIIVKCEDIFYLDSFFDRYKTKLYPGAKVRVWNISRERESDSTLKSLFRVYLSYQSIRNAAIDGGIYEIASELNFDVRDRYRFLTLPEDKKQDFLASRLRLQLFILQQEYKSREVFHLN
jgi:uncharacterized protein